jgi:two-component system response regulator YesN
LAQLLYCIIWGKAFNPNDNLIIKFIGVANIVYDREELKKMIEKEIKENYSDPEFTIEILSKKFNQAQSHFRELVYEIFSMSPHKLIEVERMQQAKILLLQGEKIYKIAKEVGYVNIRSFRKAFSIQFGYSPSAYQEILKKTKSP